MKKILFSLLSIVALGSFSSCLINPSTASENKNIDDSLLINFKPQIDSSEVTMVAVGDNLYDWYMLEAGKTGDNSFNFDDNYNNIKKYLTLGDFAVINQETPLGGDEGYLGSEVEEKYIHSKNRWGAYHGYSNFNSPDAVGNAIVKAGFNVVTMATNHVLDHGFKALENSVKFWEQYPEIPLIGIHKDKESADNITILSKNNIKIAILNYTYGVNCGNDLTKYPYSVDILNKEKIKTDVAKAKEMADFVVVFAHWGTEYLLTTSESQKKYTQIFLDAEVDVVVGTHPHIIEPIEWVTKSNGHKMLVYYSLGNFISMFKDVKCQIEGMAYLKFYKDNNSKYIKEGTIIPLVNHWNYDAKAYGGRTNFTVFALQDYTQDIAKQHGCLHYKGGVGFSSEYMNQLANQMWNGFVKKVEW
ncbi:MAG: CapA family protein [Bacteroidales bacterium]|nr:CapA family protein [Bacteroidales bacterium]